MPAAPFYRRDDVVYLKSSAEIGKLEAYKITSIKQLQSGRWIYDINITKKPPNQGVIGGMFDSRIVEPLLFYTEIDLISICEALDIICNRLEKQLVALESRLAIECSNTDNDTPNLDEPKWAIGDEAYFDASARIGFLHKAKIISIHEVGIQSGSRRTRFHYKIDNVNSNITFREDELIESCDAMQKAYVALQRDFISSENKKIDLCGGT